MILPPPYSVEVFFAFGGEIMSDIEQKLKTLPDKPGVYIMHGKDDEVIYVGKAKVLKNRVRQYFKSHNHPPKVRAMIENIAYFEYIISDSELEALVLENNLIKKYMPKYNILLKDDKTYPFLKITVNEDFPRIYMTRNVKKDGAKYFGPYQSGILLRELIELIKELFKIRFCTKTFNGDFKKQKPCLYYHLGKCVGVCNKNIQKSEYREIINDICAFLNGKYDKVYKTLNEEMKTASKNLDFEKAAVLRDRIKSIENISQKQKIITANGTDIDAIAMYSDNNITCVEIFFIRSGKMIGKEHYFIDDTDGMSNSSILTDFILRYYEDCSFIPKEILIQYDIDDKDTVAEWIKLHSDRNVNIRRPKIGENAKLISMIEANAKKEHSEYILKHMREADFVNRALSQLSEILNMDNPPMLIESYDISNISGSNNVGAMITFKNGMSYKDGYRNFKINNVSGQNDYASMKEMLSRRFNRGIQEYELIKSGKLDEEKSKFFPFPDVVFVDGGKGHVETAMDVLNELNLNIPVYGIVKDDKHRTRGLISTTQEINIDKGSNAFMLLTNIQDEMHRRAISYHKKLRISKATKSVLEEISGVGPAKRKALMAHFKTISAIKNADVNQISSVKGIDKNTAERIYNYFNEKR